MSLVKEFYAGKLKVKLFDSRRALGAGAAREVARSIQESLVIQSAINIIFAAAPSQNEFLASLVADSRIDWRRINAFHMDEYINVAANSPKRFGNFLKQRIFGKVPFKSVNYIDGNASDIEEECARYAELLRNNPIDLVCLGIGENGHLAFNDPHVASFNDDKLVKVIDLDERCRQQQMRDANLAILDEVPRTAVTLTVPALLAGKRLFCMVPAASKAEAVYYTIFGKVAESCPASILRMHDRATLYLDSDSAAMVMRSDSHCS